MDKQTQFVFEQVSTFGGEYPPITNRPDFQIDEGDDDPVFMTLPLGEVGNVSANNRLYDADFYQELVRLVNENETPIRGITGHPNPDNVAYETHLPGLEWVGATIDSDGRVWGKAYIYTSEQKVRADVRRAKMRGFKVATSLRGNGEMDGNRVTNLSDLWIDYVDADRAGVKAAVGVPKLTTEQKQGDSVSPDSSEPTPKEELKNMADEKHNADVIQLQETINQLTTYKNQWAALSELVGTTEVSKAVRELQRRNTELEPKEEMLETVVAELGTRDVVEKIQELKRNLDKVTQQAAGFTAKNLVDSKVTFAGARPMIAEMIGLNYEAPQDSKLVEMDAVKLGNHIDSLLAKPFVQETIKAQVLAASGGRAVVGEAGQVAELEDTPEARKAARARVGF